MSTKYWKGLKGADTRSWRRSNRTQKNARDQLCCENDSLARGMLYTDPLFFLVDSSPVGSGQAPELLAVGPAAAVEAVPEAALLSHHVAVFAPCQTLIGRHIGCHTQQLAQQKKAVAYCQRHLWEQAISSSIKNQNVIFRKDHFDRSSAFHMHRLHGSCRL